MAGQDEQKTIAERLKLKPRERKKQEEDKIFLTPNRLLIRLPLLLALIKAGNNSRNFKNEIKQILYLLYQHNKITKKAYNNLIKSL